MFDTTKLLPDLFSLINVTKVKLLVTGYTRDMNILNILIVVLENSSKHFQTCLRPSSKP